MAIHMRLLTCHGFNGTYAHRSASSCFSKSTAEGASRSVFKVRRDVVGVCVCVAACRWVGQMAHHRSSGAFNWSAGRLGEGFFQGLPISLNGVRKVLDFMDWQDGEVRAL